MKRHAALFVANMEKCVPLLISGSIAYVLARSIGISFLYGYLMIYLMCVLMLFSMGNRGVMLGYFALLFFLPLNNIIPNPFVVKDFVFWQRDLLPIQKYFHFMLFGGVFGLWGISLFRENKKEGIFSEKIVKLLCLFIGMEILSIIFVSKIGLSSFRGSQAYSQLRLHLVSLIVFVLTASICKNKGIIKNILAVLAASSVVVVGIGLLERLIGMNLFSYKFSVVKDFNVVTSTFWDPNYLAKYLVMVILLCLPYYIYGKTNKLWTLFLALSASTVLLFTKSGSGILSLLIGFLALYYFRKHYPERTEIGSTIDKLLSYKVLRWYLLILVLLVGGFLFFGDLNRYFSVVSYKIGVFHKSARANMDMAAFRMFKSNPVFGVGFAKYQTFFGSFNPLIHHWGKGGAPLIHNSFMKVASEMGIVGLIPLLYFYYYFAKITLIDGRKIKDEYLKILQITLGVIWIALIANSFAYWFFFEDPKVWLVAGLAFAIHRNTLSESNHKRENSAA